MVGTTAYYYLHQDALGSTRLVATASVTITFSSNYVPYGQNYGVTGREVFMYTGKPLDSATGLYYLAARYYDLNTGRFVTQDSYSWDRNDPMSQNRYIYARDNPERYVDPTGHMYAGRMWTDYDDAAFMATLVAVTTPGGQTAYLAPTQTSTTYVGGSTVTTSVTTLPQSGGTAVNYEGTSTTTRSATGSTTTSTSTTVWTAASNPTEKGPGGATEPMIGTTRTGPSGGCQGVTAAGIFTVLGSGMGLYVAGEAAGVGWITGTALTVVTGGLAALPFIASVVIVYLYYNDPTCHPSG
jgi:RHS repeat-associated protein